MKRDLRIADEAAAIVNAMSIDVEDYFQVQAMAPYIRREDWPNLPCRIERNVDGLLGMLNEAGVTATFFTLSWLAERYPAMVRRICDQGHELASHGHAHRLATTQTRTEFFQDVSRAKAILEDVSSRPIKGYRAPSFSIRDNNSWAHAELLRAGYVYSSSVYPMRGDYFNQPVVPRFPFRTNEGLLEIPVTTSRLLGRNLPTGGGGYFRLLPYEISRWAIGRMNQTEGRPAIFYLHPWEIDSDQPRVPGINLKTRFRHYVNIHRTASRMSHLLREFRWDRVDVVFGTELSQ
jgi:polysaccharide deacetylase family protein (PEP-CTERM system associated)